MIHHDQIRAARSMLNWTQAELAERAGTSRRIVVAVESGDVVVRAEILTAIVRALRDAGIEFAVSGDRHSVSAPRARRQA